MGILRKLGMRRRRGGGDALRARGVCIVAVMVAFGLCASRLAIAGGFETVLLKDGQRVTGEVVAEKSHALYVDLGYDLLRIPRDQVVRRTKVGEIDAASRGSTRSTEPDTSGFYSTGVLKPAGVKELV